MGDLTGGVHPGVGPTGRAQAQLVEEDRRQRLLENTCDGALTRLAGPTREFRSVVSDIEPQTNKPAIDVDGGLVVQR